MSLPLEDAKSLELSSIRASDNQLYVVIKDVDGNQKWILANELFDLKNITLWEFFTNGETAEFKPKETYANKELPNKKIEKVFIKNPLPITITLTPKTITIYLQDYGTVYKTEETWVNLDKRDRYKTFTDLWISLKNKLAQELGIENYQYFDRLTEEIDDKFIEYYIRQEFRVLMAQLDYLGYLICQNLPKIPETPEPKYKIGDIVFYSIFPNYKFIITKVNGWKTSRKNFLYTISSTTKEDIEVFENEIELDATPETPEPKFKIGDKVIRKGGQKVMTVINQIYDVYEEMFDYDLIFEDDSDVSYFENQLEPYEPRYKEYNIGDFLLDIRTSRKVKVVNLSDDLGELYTIDANLTDYPIPVTLKNEDVTLLKEQPKYKVGDKIKLPISTQKGQPLSGGAKSLIEMANDQKIEYLVIMYVTFDRYKDNKYDYWLGFQDLPNASVPFDENECIPYDANPKDCETDASLIVSGQVKKFYDLNKTRIEKLNPTFSCKIIKALVSLSEYEKCGKPSKIKLPKPKDDLLSEIKNLKF